jgi:hypothetical protein
MLAYSHLQVFVATSREAVPPACKRYISVDGSVPGAATTWDHHVTGELINLRAMPPTFDASGYDGVGTTLADTDALASIVAVMAGGRSRLPERVLRILEAASHRCDHLAPLPGVPADVDHLARGLHGFVSDALAHVAAEQKSTELGRLCQLVANRVDHGEPLPFDTTTEDDNRRRAAELDDASRITRRQHVAVIDVRGQKPVAPEALYERISSPVAVIVADHDAGGVTYTVGVNPFVDDRPRSLAPALSALARAEHTHGSPALAPTPTPGAENWGGRATVFGSPWNYGSRLTVDRVVAIIEQTIFQEPEPRSRHATAGRVQ